MENYFETKHKPLGSRIFAVLTAFIACLSIIGNNSFIAKADNNISDEDAEHSVMDEDIPEIDLDGPGYIVDDNPEVTAKFTPLSEEELAEIENLRFDSLKSATVKAGEETEQEGFIYSKDHVLELANSSLKRFLYQYTFTSTEKQEGDTGNYIERSDNFTPKGVITINVEHIIEAGHIEFRVPKNLFQLRDGEYCKINAIGAPKFKTGFTPVKDSNGIYDLSNIDTYKNESKQTQFNYYVDNETNEYVFVNYGALASGSTDIQVTYDKVDVFEVIDETEWSITPKATIVFNEPKSGNLRYDGQIVGESVNRNYFTECDFTENDKTSKIYMLGEETDSSLNDCILYCDVTGTPVFLHTRNRSTSESIWYDLRGKNKNIGQSYEELRMGVTPMEAAPAIEISYEQVTVTKEVENALNGRVDTTATLDSLTKSPEPNNSSGYGSQLYSIGQMKKYISVDSLPAMVKNGTSLSDNYIYTCWRVYSSGECSQPWSMLLKDTPKAAKFKSGTNEVETDANGDVKYYDVPGALVLGVSTMMSSNSKRKDHKVSETDSDDIKRLKSYVESSDLSGKNDCWYVADTNSEMRGTFGLQNATKEHKYNTGYYVVVAYPKSQLTLYKNDDIDQYPPLKNVATAYLYSRDKTVKVDKTASSSGDIVYKKFEWTGGEEYWHTYKRVDGECKDGLISVYDKLAGEPNGYIGDIWFHESYRGGAYNSCHNTQTFSHTDGLYYKVVNTDDVLTAQPYGEIKVGSALKRVYGKPQTLDGKDYFYSKAVLTISEFEVDPFEDYVYSLDSAAAAQQILAGHSDKINRDWVVYGWYDGDSNWKEIDLTNFGYANAHFTLNDYLTMKKNGDKVVLTLNFMDKGYKCPFRLKVEHNCIGYDTRLNLDLETQLKLDSPKLKSDGSLRGGNTFYYLNDSDEVIEKSAGSLDFETFRISLRNYSATKATKYEATYDSENNKVIETPKGELITNFNDSADKYYNIEGWADRTLVNANRYLFVDGDLFYNDLTHIHCNKENMTKSALGSALLPTGQLDSAYGNGSEYLPLKYINGDQTFSDLDEFVAANKHIYRDHAAIDISALETDAHAEKFASWENDTKNGQVLMTYTLSGYEGYKISKELKPLLESLNVLSEGALPKRQKVVLCDLLPLGVSYYGFEEPIVGKLTTVQVGDSDADDITLEDVDDYVSTWDNSNVKLTGINVIENWKETNRTMVTFTVEFTNTDAIMKDSNWFIGCGIRFKAYVPWDNYSSAREKDNIFAYAVHSDDTYNSGNIYGRYTGTSDSQVYDGAGINIPATPSTNAKADFSPFKKTLDNTASAETAHNRLYGHANDMESITMARTLGIKKQVRADDNIYAEYDDMTSVVKGHNYTYKIHVDKTAQGSVGDVVIFDQIEKISWEHNGNFGIFQGIDLSELIQNYPELKNKITIYYSKDRLAPTTLYKLNNNNFIFRPDSTDPMALAENVYEAQGIERIPWDFDTVNSLIETNYNSSDKWDNDEQNLSYYQWVKSTDYSGAVSDIKSIAISFGDHVFNDAFTFNIYVKMKAPGGENDKFALNEASYYFDDKIETGNYEYSKSEITVVSFGDEKILDVIKNVSGYMPDEIDDSYAFKIVSYLVYQENDKGKDFDFSNVGYNLYKNGENDNLIHATNTEGEFKLKDKEMAEFSSVAVVENETGAYDFDNFRIIEKSAPYLLSVESVNTVPGDHGNNKEQVSFTNYYRPVIYLTKKTKGVPDGVTLDDSTFSYKIKIYEGDSATPLSFADGSGYKLLSKETAGTGIRRQDAREDNKLYWYKVQESAGWYETPQGWKVNDSSEGLYKKNDNITFSAFDNTDKSFTVTFKSGETVAVPIYIQHIVGGKDVGMLDSEGNPLYRIEIEEVGENDWYCTSSNKSGELGAGENSYIWVNNYMYKELLVKKTVTHAPSESILRTTPFTFKLTDKNGAPYYEYKTGQTVNWQLCTMDQQGNITPLEGAGKSGEVANDGTFTVTGCGNASDSTGDAYVIKLSYVKLENGGKTAEYTVTEVDLSSDYSASKVSNTVDVKASAVYTTANIENDYLKRDITINKIVAASSMPDSKFTIVLCPKDADILPAMPSCSAVDKNGNTITVTPVETNAPAKGWSFGLSAGDSITFIDIGKVGEKFEIYEKYDSTYIPLTLTHKENEEYTEPHEIKLESANDSSFDVINGGEGYIVIRKQFKGDISEISEELNSSNIKMKLELRKTDGEYIVPNALSASANITVLSNNSSTPAANADAITFTRNDNVIINMAGLKDALGVSLDGSFRVTETFEDKIHSGDNWYIVEPDKKGGVWEFDADTKQGVIVNNITEFASENAIYKRIGFKDNQVKTPEGTISFTLKDNSGEPVKGVRCYVAKYDKVGENETFTDYNCVSDEKGIINIDFTDSEINNNGWMMNDGVMQYYLKLCFDRGVKINPSSPTDLRITENTIATDKSWGAPAGYEKSNDSTTYVNAVLLESNTRSQWTINDADTFVNTQDTEKVAFSKDVNPSGTELTSDDKNTLFRFTVSEFIGSGYQPAPHIKYAVYNIDDDISTAEPKRTGVTDLDENDLNTGWGVFTLRHGEKAILELPKNAYWQVSEDNTGKYKLVTDADGNIVQNSDDVFDENDALYADSSSIGKYNAKYIAQGFELHTTLDMLSTYPHGTDVVLINGMATAGSPMFAYYDESEDANDIDGIYRTHIAGAMYYNAAGDEKYSGDKTIDDKKVYLTYAAAAAPNGENGLIWSSTKGTASAYMSGDTLNIPEGVFYEEDGMIKYHHIVGIGKNAYNGATSLKTVFMPKYVEKIGDKAFAGCTDLCDVLWYGYETTPYYGKQLVSYPSTITEGVKVLGAYSFSNTSVDVIMPPTVVTMEAGVFKNYEGKKYPGKTWRNAPPEKGKDQNVTYLYRYGLNIPSTLRYFAPDDDDTPILDATLGGGHGETAMWNRSFYPELRIGSGDSIENMKTSFEKIGSSETGIAVDTLPLNAFYNSQARWSTIIIGQSNSANGITILSNFKDQLFHGANNSYEGLIMVFPKGKVTLQTGSFYQRHQSINYCLRVFQTENTSDLTVEGNVLWDEEYTYSAPIYVFTNLKQSDVAGDEEWAANIDKLTHYNENSKVYYKDQLDNATVASIINMIQTNNGGYYAAYWDPEVSELLYNAAGITPPNPLPAPRHLTVTDTVISNNDIYLEKKKELLD